MSLSKLSLKSFWVFLLVFLICPALYADTFVSVNPQKRLSNSITKYQLSPLTPFDEALKNEMQKYPKDSAFFVDGRTGKILSVKPLANSKRQAHPAQTRQAPQRQNPTPNINGTRLPPYQMQEEYIELLQ